MRADPAGWRDATSPGWPPLLDVTQRVYLPVLLDRRVVLRGTVAALIASLVGCRLDDSRQPMDTAPDAGSGEPTPDGPVTTGFARCGDELCLDLAHPANANLTAAGG